jgi:hypothetical protein
MKMPLVYGQNECLYTFYCDFALRQYGCKEFNVLYIVHTICIFQSLLDIYCQTKHVKY